MKNIIEKFLLEASAVQTQLQNMPKSGYMKEILAAMSVPLNTEYTVMPLSAINKTTLEPGRQSTTFFIWIHKTTKKFCITRSITEKDCIVYYAEDGFEPAQVSGSQVKITTCYRNCRWCLKFNANIQKVKPLGNVAVAATTDNNLSQPVHAPSVSEPEKAKTPSIVKKTTPIRGTSNPNELPKEKASKPSASSAAKSFTSAFSKATSNAQKSINATGPAKTFIQHATAAEKVNLSKLKLNTRGSAAKDFLGTNGYLVGDFGIRSDGKNATLSIDIEPAYGNGIFVKGFDTFPIATTPEYTDACKNIGASINVSTSNMNGDGYKIRGDIASYIRMLKTSRDVLRKLADLRISDMASDITFSSK